MAAVPRTEPFAIASIVCAVANFFGAFLIGSILAILLLGFAFLFSFSSSTSTEIPARLN